MAEQYPSINSFYKGINQSFDKQLIGIDEAYKAENCDISDGNFSRCKGSTKYFDVPCGDDISTLMKYYSSNTPVLLSCGGGSIYEYDTVAYGVLDSGYSNDSFDFINYQIDLDEILIYTNGVDNVKLFDGSTVRDLKNNGNDSTPGTSNKSPKGKFIELHKERIWLTGNSDNPNRVFFSNDFDPDDWTYPVTPEEANEHGGFIDIPTWDGGVIIGMKTLFDDIVIFKNKNVFRVFGTYPGNYQVLQVFNTVNGEILDKTIASLENTVLWTSTEGIHVFNGTNTELISERITDYFDDINKDHIKNAVATIHDRKYILSVPSGTSTSNNMIIEYDLSKGSFTVRKDINVSSFLEFGDKLLFSDNDIYVHEYNKGETFDGTNINSIWETGDLHFGSQNARKVSNRIYFMAKGTGTLRVTCESEDDSKILDIPLTDNFKFYRERIRNRGRILRFRFENIDGCDFTMKQPQFIIDFDYD